MKDFQYAIERITKEEERQEVFLNGQIRDRFCQLFPLLKVYLPYKLIWEPMIQNKGDQLSYFFDCPDYSVSLTLFIQNNLLQEKLTFAGKYGFRREFTNTLEKRDFEYLFRGYCKNPEGEYLRAVLVSLDGLKSAERAVMRNQFQIETVFTKPRSFAYLLPQDNSSLAEVTGPSYKTRVYNFDGERDDEGRLIYREKFQEEKTSG